MYSADAAGDDDEVAIRSALHLMGLSRSPRDQVATTGDAWCDRLERTLRQAAVQGELVVRCTVVQEVRRVSHRGSPAWCLSGEEGPVAKLRVDPCDDVAKRIVTFLRIAERREWAGCARLLGHCGGAVLKTWVSGVPLRSVQERFRPELISSVSRRLASLHGPSARRCFLVCGADEYNTVVKPDGQVAFVDLEACTQGSRWLDLAWSEALLCRSEDERAGLWRGYLEATGKCRPDRRVWQRARTGYLRWFRTQLLGGRARRPDDPDILRDLVDVDTELAMAGPGSAVRR
jgi:hypothetical protein